ncbi:MAG TPA: histidine kinase [Steroidobacteraceae bacterium]|nr:histidine kinase [Steroidobacteraceae bacterium]
MTETDTAVRPTRWRGIAAIWLAAVLFDSCETVLFMHAVGRTSRLLIFVFEAVSWLPWVLATPLVIHLARRYTLTRGKIAAAVGVHLAAVIVLTLLAETWFAMLQAWLNPWDYTPHPTFAEAWRTSLPYQVLPYFIVYGLIWGIVWIGDARERTARLNEELAKAKLAALRGQMEPHFMFNTLNSIAGLVREQRSDAAVNMIVGLSEFLRRATEDSHRMQVTLAEEVEYLQRYLDIQKVRFGERLQVSVDIPQEILHAQVPNLLLQPLVENAIKHGIAHRVAGGAVRVSGTRDNGVLRLSVSNDGPNVATEKPAAHTGIGLDNLRTRLQILHGNESELHLTRAPGGQAEVVVTLPLTEA